jgi:hypothetical protein
MRLYAITDMASLAASPLAAGEALMALASQWAVAGIDVIQIREKQLAAGALEESGASLLQCSLRAIPDFALAS